MLHTTCQVWVWADASEVLEYIVLRDNSVVSVGWSQVEVPVRWTARSKYGNRPVIPATK